MRWHSIHVHYYDANIDGLLLDAVRPLFAALGTETDGAYYIRHWKRGPHVRINVQTGPDRFRQVVLPATREHVGGYLARRPSQAVPDPERLLPLHRRLAEFEQEEGPLLPWRPNNSLHVAQYDRRLHVLGSAAAADLLEEYYVATTELAFMMTDLARTEGKKLRLAFDLMVAVAHAFSGSGITRGFVSYRSHAAGFLHGDAHGDQLREEWDNLYRARADELIDRVRTVVAAYESGTRDIPYLAPWVAALRPFEACGHRLIESGAVSMDYSAAPRASETGPSTRDGLSEFHQRMLANDSFMQVIRPSTWFATYRLIINYTYLHLTRLGVTPVERSMLCHLAANAVEDCFGVSAMDLISQPARLPTTAGGE